MEPGPARDAAGADGNRRDGALALPAVCLRPVKFLLTAAAGLALAFGAVTGMPATPATAAVSAPATATAHTEPVFEPCPCINPICRPGCSQAMASGGPAATMAAPQPPGAATALRAATGIIRRGWL
jgi:hypothetical protein